MKSTFNVRILFTLFSFTLFIFSGCDRLDIQNNPTVLQSNIYSISPLDISAKGGQLVTIEGEKLQNTKLISINGFNCQITTVISSDKVQCLTPSLPKNQSIENSLFKNHASSIDEITVLTKDKQKYVMPVKFNIWGAPEIKTVSENKFSLSGGETVSATGKWFDLKSATVENNSITISIPSQETMNFTTPSHAEGLAKILFVDSFGQEAEYTIEYERAKIELSESSLFFATPVAVTESLALPLTFKNSQKTKAVNLSAVSTDPNFQFSVNCTELAYNQECIFTAVFQPLSAGIFSTTAKLKYFDGVSENTISIPVSSTAFTIPTVTFNTTNGSFINQSNLNSFLLSGTCSEVGKPVNLQSAGVNFQTLCLIGNIWFISHSFTSSLIGPIQVTADHSNNSGYPALTALLSLNFDITAPNLFVNALPNANKSNTNSYSVSGNCETGLLVNVFLGSTLLNQVNCNNLLFSATLNLQPAIDGSVTLTFKQSDIAGNTVSIDKILFKDTVDPVLTVGTLSTVNLSNVNAYLISGTCSEPSTINLSFNGGTSQVTSCITSFSFTSNLSLLNDGSITVNLQSTDSFGNSSQWQGPVTKDTSTSTLVVNSYTNINLANVTSYPLSGTCTETGTVKVEWNGSSLGTTNCSGLIWNLNLNLSALPEGALVFEFSILDIAGNNSNLTKYFFKDSISPSSTINSFPKANASNVNTFELSGSCSEASSVSLLVNGTAQSTSLCNTSLWNITLNLSSFSDGILNLTFNITDNSGNSNSYLRNLEKDTVLPILTLNSIPSINSFNENSFTVSGSCSENSSVALKINGALVGNSLCSALSPFTLTLNLLYLSDGNQVFEFNVTDDAGNLALVTRNVLKDTTTPILSVNPLSIINLSNVASYLVSGSCSTGELKIEVNGVVRLQQACLGMWTHSLDLSSGVADGNVVFKFTLTSLNGNSTVVNQTTTKDTIAPTNFSITGTSPVAPILLNSSITIQLGNSAGASTYTVSISTNSQCNQIVATQSQSSNSILFTDSFAVGTYYVCAKSTDLANNETLASNNGIFSFNIILPITLTSVNPATGPMEGGTTITVQGTQFLSGNNISITIDGVICANLTIQNDQSLSCITGVTTNEGTFAVRLQSQNPTQSINGPGFKYDSNLPPLARHDYDAAQINGTPNSGDIAANMSTTWNDSGTTPVPVTLAGFGFTPLRGWRGDSSVVNPYRLTFKNDTGGAETNSYVSAGTLNVPTYSVWFSPSDQPQSAQRGILSVKGLFVAYMSYGQLKVNPYADDVLSTPPLSVGLILNQWHHLMVTKEAGGLLKFYLDGNLVGTFTNPNYLTSTYNTILASATYYGGSDGFSWYQFDGSIGRFQTFHKALSLKQISTLYQWGRTRYYVDNNSIKITKLVPGVTSNITLSPIIINGWHLDEVTQVKVGNQAVPFTIISGAQLSFTPPPMANGFQTITLDSSNNSYIFNNILLYTATQLSNLTSYYHSASIDAAGARGPSTQNSTWISLAGFQGAPASGPVGWWMWMGSALNFTDPFKAYLQSYSYFNLGNIQAQTYAVWFKDANPIQAYWNSCVLGRQHIQAGNVSSVSACTISYNINGSYVKKMVFSNHAGGWGSVLHTINMDQQWHHLVISNSASDGVRRYYLDGSPLISDTGTPVIDYGYPEEPNTELHIGRAYQYLGGYWQGSIGQVKTYSTAISDTEVLNQFNEEKAWYLP